MVDDQATTIADEFFAGYTRALLDRDVAAIADHYAVPALIEFPDAAIAVASAQQTTEFFAQALAQYADVTHATPTLSVVASTAHSMWVDVAWDYRGAAPTERSMYQLARREGSWRIVVLTPLAEPAPPTEPESLEG